LLWECTNELQYCSGIVETLSNERYIVNNTSDDYNPWYDSFFIGFIAGSTLMIASALLWGYID